MDLSCIILSGDLELYVLGMLPEEEAYKIEQLTLLFPEVKDEVDRIAESLFLMSNTAEATPSPSVKTNLMARLKELKEEENNGMDLPAHKAAPVISIDHSKNGENIPSSETPIVSLYKERNQTFLKAAAVIGIIASIGVIGYLVSVNNKKNNEVAALQVKVEDLNKNINDQQQSITAYSQTVNMMQSADYKKIDLMSTKDADQPLAKVMWNANTKEVYLSDFSLPKAPSGKQYQLWAIVDGKPVDAGLITNAKGYAQQMKKFEKAEMFAITLENEGGSPTPTMEAMYAAGKVS